MVTVVAMPTITLNFLLIFKMVYIKVMKKYYQDKQVIRL